MTLGRRMVANVVLALTVMLAAAWSGTYLYVARGRSVRSTMPVAPRSPPLAPTASAVSVTSMAPQGVAVRIVSRLIDQLDEAQVSVPSLGERQVKALLKAHWRRHLTPHASRTGQQARLVQSVGLSLHPTAPSKAASNDPGKSYGPRPALGGAGSARPQLDDTERRERNIRTFGLGQGTFEERECIVAPPPGSLRFKLHLPRNAKLRVAPALLGEGETVFTVAFRKATGGESRVLGTQTLRGPSRRYVDWTLDLAKSGCENCEGELELSTASVGKEPALALWGSPVILAPELTRLPYNVLFVIVDAMRSDAIAASHDPVEDQRRRQAKHAPLDAWFEAMPEVAPELDRLAASGAIWEHSWSAAMWTRPATLSLLTGLRASHTGLDILALELIGDQRRNFYARRPPQLALMLRQAGASTQAIVNNMYLSGSVGVGIDFGFESVVDHRLNTMDTRNITNDALAFLDERGKERFFLLLNYAAPHAPYEPGPDDARAVHKAANRPADPMVQNYLAEVHKDDAAIGQVMRKLDELKLRERTLVVVTADHGETMSAAHDVVAVDVAAGVRSGRFTHLSTMWEEAARVAMILSLPGKIPSGRRLDVRVQNLDLLPTILELEGLPVPPELDGRSLLPELEGKSVDDRPVVIEGRGARSIIDDKFHLIVRDPVARRLRCHGEEYERTVELFDLESDPGERKDIASNYPEVVARLRNKLELTLAKHVDRSSESSVPQRIHVRFSTAGKARQLEVVLYAKAGQAKVLAVGLEPRSIHVGANEIRITTPTRAEGAVGFDLELGTALPTLAWEIKLDGGPWPADHVYAGSLGIAQAGLVRGLASVADISLVDGSSLPHIVASEELGMFVTRDPINGPAELETSAEAQLEAQQAMQAWGYARKPLTKKTE